MFMFSQNGLTLLKKNIKPENYLLDNEWVLEFLDSISLEKEDWLIPLSPDLQLDNNALKLKHDKTQDKAKEDLKNIKLLYDNFKSLPLDLATDERFWAYHTHFTFKDYMKERWPYEEREFEEDEDNIGTDEGDNTIASNINAKYFFKAKKTEGDRDLVRNGISRLWWYAHITYESERENPYELTEYLLQTIDFTQQFVERSYSRNPYLVRNILRVMKDDLDFSPKGIQGRLKYREVFKSLNQVGGMKILDFLGKSEVYEIIAESLKLKSVPTS